MPPFFLAAATKTAKAAAPAPAPTSDLANKWLSPNFLLDCALGIAIIIAGFLISKLVARVVEIFILKHFGVQPAQISRKTTIILVRAIAIFIGLKFLGIKEIGTVLAPFIGAAGIVGVAIGFASQTSLSNIISGGFVLWEKPFAVGDVIEVDGIQGFVESIGLLSLELRTFDNKSVRIPNELIIKTKVINVTRHPIRRCDVTIGTTYSEDISHVISTLKDVLLANPDCLDEPEPVIVFQGFGASSLDFLVSAWCVKADFLKIRNSLTREIKEAFDRENISFASPHRTLGPDKNQQPIPIVIVPKKENSSDWADK